MVYGSAWFGRIRHFLLFYAICEQWERPCLMPAAIPIAAGRLPGDHWLTAVPTYGETTSLPEVAMSGAKRNRE